MNNSVYEPCPNCGLKFRRGRAIHSHLKSCNRFKPHELFVERWNNCGRYSTMGAYYGLPASTISNYIHLLRDSPIWGSRILSVKQIERTIVTQQTRIKCDICKNEIIAQNMKRHLENCVPRVVVPEDAPRCACDILLKTEDELAKGKCVFCQQTRDKMDYLQIKRRLILQAQ